MATTTSILVTLIVIGIFLTLILVVSIYHLCARNRNKESRVRRNAEDTIRLTLTGTRSTEQIEYMKHVRERNLVVAWESSKRFTGRQRQAKMVGYDNSVFEDRPHTFHEDEEGDEGGEEVDLGSVKSGKTILGTAQGRMYLAPPPQPWMKRLPTSGSSVYSSESAKSKAASVVEEWENEHGKFTEFVGMKQPIGTVVRDERWA